MRGGKSFSSSHVDLNWANNASSIAQSGRMKGWQAGGEADVVSSNPSPTKKKGREECDEGEERREGNNALSRPLSA